MRQIRFREWLGKEFHYWGFLRDGAFIGPSDPKGIHNQFTGLLDKNGKEIYEGDIMNGRNQVLKIVKWDERRAAFVYIEQFKPKTVKVSFAQMYDKFRSVFCKDGLLPNHEVVGNVFENPDLLK